MNKIFLAMAILLLSLSTYAIEVEMSATGSSEVEAKGTKYFVHMNGYKYAKISFTAIFNARNEALEKLEDKCDGSITEYDFFEKVCDHCDEPKALGTICQKCSVKAVGICDTNLK